MKGLNGRKMDEWRVHGFMDKWMRGMDIWSCRWTDT